MNSLPYALLAGVMLWAVSSHGGDKFPVALKGTVYQVNSSGNIGGTAVTERSMVEAIASRAGVAPSSIAIVYHVGGTAFGDTIDVINKQTGQVLDNLYGFYFGSAFNRRVIDSADGKDQRRLDYVYTSQNSVALGSAVVTKKQVVSKKGAAPRLYVEGRMQWIVQASGQTPGQICTGTFTTGPQLTF